MSKKKLFDDIRQSPARIYRTPGDVLRDRRFDDSERLEILRAWAAAAPKGRREIADVIAELETRLHIPGHAAE